MKKYIIALTGASGIIYGIRLAKELLSRGFEVHLIVSEPACIVMKQELIWEWNENLAQTLKKHLSGNICCYNNSDISASIASGSFRTDGMIVIPCTMSTVANIAHGISRDLITRAADVQLKERRPLILVPRETPLNSIHLRNMLSLSEMGVHIIPAMPAFYHQPKTIDDMVLFIVGKVLDVMGIDHDLYCRYKSIQ
ncbi:MAG: UbiX family flavin prenyltransferase [Syntrophomonadaceae bacterium]